MGREGLQFREVELMHAWREARGPTVGSATRSSSSESKYDSLEYNRGSEEQPRRKVIIEGMIDIGCDSQSHHPTETRKRILIEGAHKPVGYAAAGWRRPPDEYLLEDPTPTECEVDVHNALMQQIESGQVNEGESGAHPEGG
ncbi:hypothetical protein FOZ63_006412, partial [Perkinsus olseni]